MKKGLQLTEKNNPEARGFPAVTVIPKNAMAIATIVLHITVTAMDDGITATATNTAVNEVATVALPAGHIETKEI
jgi:hypothetical protein